MEPEKEKHPNLRSCYMNLKRQFDEYYTRYEHVEDIFNRYIPEGALKDKIIYCPCDSPKSNFVIYLKEHKDDLQYKELIYTWDDYNTHMDLFEYCDVIITNPPFSKLTKELIPILNKVKKEYFLLGSLISMYGYYENIEDKDNLKIICDTIFYDFILPEGCDLNPKVKYVYVTNLNCPNYRTAKDPDGEKISDIIMEDKEGNKYKVYDKIRDIPRDEYDEILVPSTVILEHNRKYFDILKARIREKYFSDGKNRYTRTLVKRKKYIEEQ